MSLLVVGSMAFDSIKTPHGEVKDTLGGSAVYFSLAASLFSPVRLVGVVGGDFATSHIEMLRRRSVDIAGLEIIENGKTFRWSGEYAPNMNDRETLEVDLNVFADFKPRLPSDFRDTQYVFLANGSPATQLSVIEQMSRRPALVVADTMDLWINIQRPDLNRLLERVDGLVINDSEAHLLTGEHNVIRAGRAILGMGPSFVVLKKGEHGSILFSRDTVTPLPAFPTESVVDPTGAGDSFAGAMMGYLASVSRRDDSALRHSIVHGTVTASFTVEDYGTARLQNVTRGEVDERHAEYRRFLSL